MKAQCRPSLCRSSRRRRKLTQSQLNRSRSPTKRKRTSRRCYDRHLVCATRLFCAKFLGRRAVYNLSISLEPFELGREARILSLPFATPAWRNWQTRWTQNPVIARSCGFEPLRRQSSETSCTFTEYLSHFVRTTFRGLSIICHRTHHASPCDFVHAGRHPLNWQPQT